MKLFVWIFVLLLSGILYWHWGSTKQVLDAYQVNTEIKKIKTEITNSGSIDALIKRLENKVKTSPNDPQGHFLLARLYLSDQNINKALQSFEKANALKPKDPEIMVNYAQAIFLKNNRKLNTKAKDLINQVLKIDMQNINALNLLAIDAFDRKEYKAAINYWERVLIQLPLNTEEAKQIETMIEKAKTSL